MAGAALLTEEQVAELAEKSTSWVRHNRELIPPTGGGIARNGKAVPLYNVSALPADLQQRWARTQMRKVVEMLPAKDTGDKIAPDGARAGGATTGAPGQMALALTAPVGPNLSDEDRAEAERRFRAIEPLVNPEKFPLLMVQFPRKRDLLPFLAQQASAELKRQVKVRTVYEWLQRWQKGGLPALVRKDRADKGHARAMNDAAKALLLKMSIPQRGVYGVLRVAEMWRLYQEERAWRDAHVTKPMGEFERDKYAQYLDAEDRLTPAAQLPQVSYETFRVWFNRIPEMVRTMGRDGEDAYRNSQEIITHRDIAAVKPMDWVVMDHRVLDLFCLVRERGGWKLARPWLTAAIDMRTRKWLAWSIVETPSSDSIATVLKKVFLNFGLPGELYWDNGKDFRCEWFEGRARRTRQAERIADLDPTWRGVLGTLGIRVRHAIAYNARAKIIESNFNRISNVDRTLPEWCGHEPGARPEHYAELVKQHDAWAAGERDATPFRTIEEIAALYGDVLRDLNERPLEGEGMRKTTPTGHAWLCPNEAWELNIGAVARRSVPADVLHMCFAKRRELTVQHGELKTTHNERAYYYRMSDNSLRLQMLNGKTVQFAYDPLDLGEGAIYYEDRFFGLATCVELRRMGEQAFVQDERDRRAARREVKRAILAASHVAPGVSLEERLARRAEVRPERAERPRVELPAAIAAPVAEAAAAVEADKGFDFQAAKADVVSATEPAAPSEDEEFNFFGN
jgi:transposase InsO family protein